MNQLDTEIQYDRNVSEKFQLTRSTSKKIPPQQVARPIFSFLTPLVFQFITER